MGSTTFCLHTHDHSIESCTQSNTCKFIRQILCILRAVTKVKLVNVLTEILSDVLYFSEVCAVWFLWMACVSSVLEEFSKDLA